MTLSTTFANDATAENVDQVTGYLQGADGYKIHRKKQVNCKNLLIKMASKKLIPMCAGLNGVIADLTIDFEHVPDREGLPIDLGMEDIFIMEGGMLSTKKPTHSEFRWLCRSKNTAQDVE